MKMGVFVHMVVSKLAMKCGDWYLTELYCTRRIEGDTEGGNAAKSRSYDLTSKLLNLINYLTLLICING